jgi:hypothetical protein
VSAETLILGTGLATVVVTGVGLLVTLKSVRDQLWLQMFSEYTRRYHTSFGNSRANLGIPMVISVSTSSTAVREERCSTRLEVT